MTLEITEFRLNPGAKEAEFLAASEGLDGFLRSCPGFISRQLVRHENGGLADVVCWSTRAAAETAMQKAGNDARAAAYFRFIAADSVVMRHAAVLQSSRR